jgi:hypothetical protein
MVEERLNAYWTHPALKLNATKERLKLPKRIIYYRDGVSEGQ